jgi:hypothetical protein
VDYVLIVEGNRGTLASPLDAAAIHETAVLTSHLWREEER